MFPAEEATIFSGTRLLQDFGTAPTQQQQQQQQQKIKKKRSLPGNPDPDAEVIALSPKTLLATNRFVCEICNKGFQRDQNLQLHRRGHNLPWKLKQRNNKDVVKKRAYVCPEPTCVHHHPSRALGDLTGIKKHFCRKHGEKKWKCDKCSKIYAVQSDWKAHSKTCGTREYRCDCGTLFSRKDSFITHRAFCDALAEESARLSAATNPADHLQPAPNPSSLFSFQTHISLNPWVDPTTQPGSNPNHVKPDQSTTHHFSPLITPPSFQNLHVSNNNLIPSSNASATSSASTPPAHLSATALLQKAATFGATSTQINNNNMMVGSHLSSPDFLGFAVGGNLATWQKSSDRFTRDFLGLTGSDHHHHQHVGGGRGGGGGNIGSVNVSLNVRDMLNYAGGLELQQHFERDQSSLLMKAPQGFGLAEPASGTSWGTDC